MKLTIRDSDSWEPRRYHGLKGKRQWKVTDTGIVWRGPDKLEAPARTPGEPKTMERIWDQYGHHIREWSSAFGVPAHLVAALIGQESGGRPKAEKHEAHVKDWSFGLTQVLTNTASGVGIRTSLLPRIDLKPLPEGGDIDEWRLMLNDVETNIGYGTFILKYHSELHDLNYDPILTYAAYNAGSPRAPKAGEDNVWGIHAAARGKVLTYFARWYGDACYVMGYCA